MSAPTATIADGRSGLTFVGGFEAGEPGLNLVQLIFQRHETLVSDFDETSEGWATAYAGVQAALHFSEDVSMWWVEGPVGFRGSHGA